LTALAAQVTVAVAWNFAPLSELAEITMGQSPPSSTYNTSKSGVPFLQGKAEFGPRNPLATKWCSQPAKVAAPRSVLVSVRAPVGDVNQADREYCIGRGLAAIAPGPALDADFLYFTMLTRQRYLASMGTGSTFQSINANVLRTLEIPVPPLDEQRRVARILSTIQMALEAAHNYAHSLFLLRVSLRETIMERLGSNPRLFGDVVEIVSGQVDPTKEPYASLPHVAPDSIEQRTGRIIATQTARSLHLISGKYLFAQGDVLYSKIRPHLVKAAIAPSSGTCSADMYVLSPKAGSLTREFLLELLLSNAFTRDAMSHQSRTGIPKINREQLNSIVLQVPHIKDQMRADGILRASRQACLASDAYLESLSAVFDSAIDRSFARPE
jgi:type I restriction enzyme S subunit